MVGEDNRLTLVGLARKVEALTERLGGLEIENERVRSENAGLRRKVASLEGAREPLAAGASGSAPRGGVVAEAEGPFSRRRLFGKVGAAAAGLALAGALTQRDIREAKAEDFDFVLSRTYVQAYGGVTGFRKNSTSPGVLGFHQSGGSGVRGIGGIGVSGEVIGLDSGYGVVGDGKGEVGAGVLGRNPDGIAVRGESGKDDYASVYGLHTGTSGYGVVGDGKGGGAGVLGRNPGGTGVRGESSTQGSAAVLGDHSGAGAGVSGESTGGIGVKGSGRNGVLGFSTTLDQAAVLGSHTGMKGYGVVGEGSGLGAGVLGRNGGGEGVRGEGRTGVYGKASVATGYGATFEGGRAQLRIVPKTTAGRPTTGTHVKGEIYMDSASSLFVCVANGTPGTWRRVATTA